MESRVLSVKQCLECICASPRKCSFHDCAVLSPAGPVKSLSLLELGTLLTISLEFTQFLLSQELRELFLIISTSFTFLGGDMCILKR